MLKVLIIGPGAVGIAMASRLELRRKYEICLGISKRHRKVVDRGFIVETPDGHKHFFKPRCTMLTDEELPRLEPFDVIIVATKIYDLENALSLVKNVVGIETSVVTIQNGWNPHDICAKFYGVRAVHAAITLGAMVINSGVIKIVNLGEAYIGSRFGVNAYVTRALNVLRDVGMRVYAVEDIDRWIALKLVVNVGINALTALLRVPNGALLDPLLNDLVIDVVTEAAEVVEKCLGISLPTNAAKIVNEILRATASNKSSMLQDLERGRESEIEFLNCAIDRIARSCGERAKLNRMLCALVKWLERCRRMRCWN